MDLVLVVVSLDPDNSSACEDAELFDKNTPAGRVKSRLIDAADQPIEDFERNGGHQFLAPSPATTAQQSRSCKSPRLPQADIDREPSDSPRLPSTGWCRTGRGSLPSRDMAVPAGLHGRTLQAPMKRARRFPAAKYLPGSTASSFRRTSKCRCGPVERPVEPTLAMGVPVWTVWPSLAMKPERCA